MSSEKGMPLHAQLPDLGTSPIPVEPYISQSYYDREIEKIFKRDWLCVGRVEQIPNPGDYEVKKLDFANTSIILMRGKDGVLRAFHNICRHRGNKVIIETGGEETFGHCRSGVVACRFHGWIYDSMGQLTGIPKQSSFPECFEKSSSGLFPVHLDTWQGFIFVNLEDEPRQTLSQFLGPLVKHYENYPFHLMTSVRSYHAHIKCNWKIGMDAFAEGYHVATIHAGSLPGLRRMWTDNLYIFNEHHSLSAYSQFENPPTPVARAANEIFSASIATKAPDRFTMPPEINPDRSENFGFELMSVFPNFILHCGGTLWFTHQFWPVTQDSCLWEGRYYMEPPTSNSEAWAHRYATTLQRNAWYEDTATMEDTQRALASGKLKEMPLMDEEILIRHAARVIEDRVNSN